MTASSDAFDYKPFLSLRNLLPGDHPASIHWIELLHSAGEGPPRARVRLRLSMEPYKDEIVEVLATIQNQRLSFDEPFCLTPRGFNLPPSSLPLTVKGLLDALVGSTVTVLGGAKDSAEALPSAVASPEAHAEILSPEVCRGQRAQALLADILSELVEELRADTAPSTSARALRAITQITQTAQPFLGAIRGTPIPRRRGKLPYIGTSSYDGGFTGEDDFGDDLEPAAGLNSGMQKAENHGSRVINEVVALGRAYLTQQGRPKLSELMSAFYTAKAEGDLPMMDSLRDRISTSYGIQVPSPALALVDREERLDLVDADEEVAKLHQERMDIELAQFSGPPGSLV